MRRKKTYSNQRNRSKIRNISVVNAVATICLNQTGLFPNAILSDIYNVLEVKLINIYRRIEITEILKHDKPFSLIMYVYIGLQTAHRFTTFSAQIRLLQLIRVMVRVGQ